MLSFIAIPAIGHVPKHRSFVLAPQPSHWPWLHNGEWSTEEELAVWESGIPNYGCKCKAFWRAWKAANPPPYGDPAKCFDWSVTAHNAVNAKLDRQIWSIEQALEHWLPE